MTTVATATDLLAMGAAAKAASRKLAAATGPAKTRALELVADGIQAHAAEILIANAGDYATAKASGLSDAMLDRMELNERRLQGMADDVHTVAALPDPVGEFIEMKTLPNGLQVGRVRVPLGVIASIYESRPNVTTDIAALALKAGNAVILRGGKEALATNIALARVVQQACAQAGLPEGCVQYVDNPDRALVTELLEMKQYVDLLIPRGGADLIRFVAENATMAVVTGGIGVCHTYVDASADARMALDVVINAKTRRYTICNALDTLLVHRDIAPSYLPAIAAEFARHGVEMRCDDASAGIIAGAPLTDRPVVTPAAAGDWGQEFLALVAAVKVVDSLDAALDHIDRYGSGHSEAIITEDYTASQRFLREVDAAAVYVNASTQFTDGGQFGLGAEVGISTQKFHARGPMGLREITSYKWVVLGSGQTRPL
ncbi:MAG: glutamate-5-semialdehyde dehydrogenase [Dehalococcoidia bacterium]|nr:glutamate-5-semialdehyde dehydrogenase [Dehalococcoidia bacterium]